MCNQCYLQRPVFRSKEEVSSQLIPTEILLCNRTDIGRTNMKGRGRLHNAINRLDLDAVRQLINKGIDINELHGDRAPLHLAICMNNVPAVTLLLERGADVSIVNRERVTPIRFVSRCNQVDVRYDMYKLLLEHGADCNEKSDVATVFLCTFAYDNLRTVKLFLNHGADIAATDAYGGTAIHYAAENGCFSEVLDFLLDQGFDANCLDGSDLSPLHFAARCSNLIACYHLLQHGASVNRKTRTIGITPLVAAVYAEKPNVQIVKLLLYFGADVSVAGSNILKMVACDKDEEDYVYEEIKPLLMEHMAKRRYQNLHINEDDRHTIETKDCYRDHYKACLQELESMENTKFYNNVSVLNVLLESQKVISGYTRNAELVEALEEIGYANLFPIYFDSLQERLDIEVAKCGRRSKAAKILSDIFMFNDFTHPVTQKILNYLRCTDFKFLF